MGHGSQNNKKSFFSDPNQRAISRNHNAKSWNPIHWVMIRFLVWSKVLGYQNLRELLVCTMHVTSTEKDIAIKLQLKFLFSMYCVGIPKTRFNKKSIPLTINFEYTE